MNERLYPSRALHAQVAHHIGRRIASGAIAEGALLPREAELAQQFSFSRQAIREALKVLAAKGLVASRRRTGTFVLPRSSWNLLDPDVLAWHPPERLPPSFFLALVELRRVIEPKAAEFAAERGSPDKVAAVGAALEEMRRTVGEPPAFNRADAEFHVAIFAASGNELFDRLSTILRPLLNASLPVQETARGGNEDAIVLHERVYDAIVAHNPVAARRAMETMLSLASLEIGRATGATAG